MALFMSRKPQAVNVDDTDMPMITSVMTLDNNGRVIAKYAVVDRNGNLLRIQGFFLLYSYTFKVSM